MLFLAIRHLIARKRQTLMTFLGIFFASSSFVAITGFFLGFQEYLVDQLINNDAHIRISAREEYVDPDKMEKWLFDKQTKHVFWSAPPGGKKDNDRIINPQGWYSLLEKDPRIEAYSPQTVIQVMASRAAASLSAKLIGSDILKQQYVTNIQNYMIQGKFTDIASGGNRIIAGDEFLKKIGAQVSETIILTTGRGASIPFKVIGAFHLGLKPIDEGTLFASITDTQKLNQTPSLVNQIAIRMKNVELAKEVANTWSEFTDDQVKSWDELSANVLNVFNIQNAMRYTVTSVIILVASFGVYNILNMVVTQKRKDIAILRSMGYEKNDVIQLFLLQGIILGLLGGGIGTFVGYWLCRGIEMIPFGGPMGGTGHMLVSFNKLIYIRGFTLAVLASTLASYFPARAAGKMQPIEIIRAGAE